MAANTQSIVQLKEKLRDFNTCLASSGNSLEDVRQMKQALQSLLEELSSANLVERSK